MIQLRWGSNETDEEILEYKALVGRYGFGCEPASAATLAGLRQLIREQIVSADDNVVCILTGHELKDPDATVKYHTGIDMKAVEPPPPVPTTGPNANPPLRVADDLEAICAALGETLPEGTQRQASADRAGG